MKSVNHREPIDGPKGKDTTYVYTHIEGDNEKPLYNFFIRLYSDQSCDDEYLITSKKIYSVDWTFDTVTNHKKVRVWQTFKKPIPVCGKIRLRFGMKIGAKSFYVKFTTSKLSDPLSGTVSTIGCITVK